MLRVLKRDMTLEHKDTRSGHIWRYEIDAVDMTVKIYKNNDLVKSMNEVVLPVSDSWLTEQRDGL
jgi:purine-nucleoside phosphorylase